MISEEQRINELRKKIDRIDEKIVKELNVRAKIVVEIRKLKNEADLPIFDLQRENEIFTKIALKNMGPLNDASLKEIYEKILLQMKSFE